ncbi:50S ribosomal protein L25/general stress protein Ctc [Gloeocapsa sp. PCC 73106]|uniref:50S ribosomal protein L25/general stress protein Ctc n=1 Tax=Gloeocapsa sp. PCC 73106 TaxID=102232 RepID=UPI0002AC9075|nr:50S ribosomal protein L25/general stress protein Ctc [Gloeocapsa sp. PCC 73106]ELS00172.1 ribosomal protein L25, Ctc-form [Gloeocapsa sp. PCC 73106]
MNISVQSQKRPEGSKPGALRRQGLIPSVLYGHNGTESVPLVISSDKVTNLLKKASVNNTIVELDVTDMPWNGPVLIREVQSHPWKRNIYHVSFFSVATQGRLDITVPIRLIGEAFGVKQGGVLEQLVTELKVQCLADKIPESIDVDMTDLDIGAVIHVHELNISEGVTVMDEPDKIVLTIVSAKE